MAASSTLEIVCLAKSRKSSGHCIAGKLLDGPGQDRWIRPVSQRPTAELATRDLLLPDGSQAGLLNVLRIPVRGPHPHPFQPENYLVKSFVNWTANGSIDWRTLVTMRDSIDGPLWENLGPTRHGLNDRVDAGRAPDAVGALGGSLKLIGVNDLTIVVGTEATLFDDPRRKTRGSFTCAGHRYKLSVTDPNVELSYPTRPDGEYPVGRAIICVSLGDPFHGFAYKLIAAVHLPPKK